MQPQGTPSQPDPNTAQGATGSQPMQPVPTPAPVSTPDPIPVPMPAPAPAPPPATSPIQPTPQPVAVTPPPITPPTPTSSQPQPSTWQSSVPSAPQSGTSTPQPQSGPGMPAPSNKRPLIMVIVGVLVLGLIGAGVYFWFNKSNNKNANDAAKQSTGQAGLGTKDMSTLAHVTFTPPSDMSAYKPRTVTTSRYSYELLNTGNQFCNLTFGTFSQTELPGTDISAIVKPQLDKLKLGGATIKGPDVGSPLVLPGTKSGKYSLPTLHYEVSEGGIYEVDHYSLAVLTSGERIVVSRVCASRGAAVNTSYLDTLDATAKKLTVTPQ